MGLPPIRFLVAGAERIPPGPSAAHGRYRLSAVLENRLLRRRPRTWSVPPLQLRRSFQPRCSKAGEVRRSGFVALGWKMLRHCYLGPRTTGVGVNPDTVLEESMMRFSRRPRGSERRGPDGAHEGADAKWLLVARDGLLASILLLAVLLLAGVLVTGEQMNAAAPVVWSFFHGHTLWE